MEKIGFIYNEIFLKHSPVFSHPERPERLEYVLKYVKNWENSKDVIDFIEPQYADVKHILLNHSKAHYEYVKTSIEQGATILDYGDTYCNEHSFDAAMYAAGAGIKASDLVLNGDYKKVFCAVRPPGHHAEKDKVMGFCIFNNIAIAAHYLLQKGVGKVMIVDFDVHHGNGTQRSFYESDRVYYVSSHQYPFYPGTGSREERGSGKGKGFTLNLPVPGGTTGEKVIGYYHDFVGDEILKFKPEVLLFSAGFDAHTDDIIGGLKFWSRDFKKLTQFLVEVSDEFTGGRVISFLEGGYELSALGESVVMHLEGLLT